MREEGLSVSRMVEDNKSREKEKTMDQKKKDDRRKSMQQKKGKWVSREGLPGGKTVKVDDFMILYSKESIQAYEITQKSEADCKEAIWCNIVTRNSTLTIGVVYRSPNIGQEENVKLQKVIEEVSKGECVIMGDFNHDHIQW